MITRIILFFVALLVRIIDAVTAFIHRRTNPRPRRLDLPLLNVSYSLKPLVGPVVSGSILRLVACIPRIPVIGSLFAKQLIADNKLDDVITFACNLPDPFPMGMPPTIRPNTPSLRPNDVSSTRACEGPSQVWKLHTAFLSKTLTPTQFLEHSFNAIDKHNRRLMMFVMLDREGARAAAAASTERFARGVPLSPIDGIPVSVKCCIPVKGFVNTIGATMLGNELPETEDAESVARLRAAGAVIIGLNNMHELGIGATGANGFYGSTRNPFDETKCSGGSSSGGAVALATGIVPLVLATDGGGSGRIPIAFSSAHGAGFKQGFGVVPSRPRCAASVYHETPMALTVEDARIMLEILCKQEIPPRNVPLPQIKVGVFRPYANDACAEQRGAFEDAERRLRSVGCQVVEITIPNLDICSATPTVSILSEIRIGVRHKIEEFTELDPATQLSLALGGALSGEHILGAHICRRFLVERVVPHIFEQCDAVLSPALGILPPPVQTDRDGTINISDTSAIARFLFFANVTGVPALSVGMGLTENVPKSFARRMPVAVHLMANYGGEDLLVRLGSLLERSITIRPPEHNNFFHSVFAE